jgi:hypothetical protein
LEHMLDKPRAMRQVHRVHRVGGVFICLTPSAREVETLIGGAGLALQRFEHWRFIPQGDLPVGCGWVLRALDWVAHLRVGYLRGAIAFSAVRTD